MTRARDLADSADLAFDGDTLKIDSANNRVGIGIASPTAPLSVDETGAAIKLNESNVASDTYVDMRASSAAFGYDSSKLAATIQAGAGNKFISFNVNNNTFGSGEVMRIDSNGKVGIGTASPSGTLEVAASEPTIRLTDSDNSYYAELRNNNGNLELRADHGDGIAGSVMTFTVDNSEKMRITDGKLGIGTSSPTSPLHVETTSQRVGTFISTGADPQVYIGDAPSSDNAFVLGYDRADNRGYLTVAGDSDSVFTIANGGNVGIGTASPNSPTKLEVNGDITVGWADKFIGARFGNGSEFQLGMKFDTTARTTKIVSETTDSNGEITFEVNGSERMRIDNSGKLLVATTTAGGNGYTFDTDGFLTHARASGSAQSMVGFKNGGSFVGEIRTSTTATSYLTSSDHRLKENAVDMTGAITRVKNLQPKRFNFISDTTDTLVDGFMAHEAQTVVPEAVSGTHNEVDDDDNPVYQGIDQSKLVPLLTGALQEAIAKIETLESKVAALEAAN